MDGFVSWNCGFGRGLRLGCWLAVHLVVLVVLRLVLGWFALVGVVYLLWLAWGSDSSVGLHGMLFLVVFALIVVLVVVIW